MTGPHAPIRISRRFVHVVAVHALQFGPLEGDGTMQRRSHSRLAIRVATLASLARLLAPFAAHAQVAPATNGPDCVMTHARDPICGRLDTLDPDRRDLAIRIADNTVRHVSWYEIVTAWGPSFPMRRTGRDAAVPYPGTVHVEFASSGAPQTLDLLWADPVPAADEFRAHPAGVLHRASCTTPCTVRMAPGAVAARISASDVDTRPIAFSIPTSDVRIHLHAPPPARARAAMVLAGIGSAMMLGGLIYPLAVATNGVPPTGVGDTLFWASLGVSAVGLVPAITSLAIEPPRGVATMERLCRDVSISSSAPWSSSAPPREAASARLPPAPTETRYVACH